jgi:hypothetical protein
MCSILLVLVTPFVLGVCGQSMGYTETVKPTVRQLSYSAEDDIAMVEVSWQPPSCNPDKVSGYRVQFKKDNYKKVFLLKSFGLTALLQAIFNADNTLFVQSKMSDLTNFALCFVDIDPN